MPTMTAKRLQARSQRSSRGPFGKVGVGRAAAAIVLVLFAIASVVPMIWLILAPSKTSAEIGSLHPFAFGDFNGYRRAWENLMFFEDGVILHWLWNSVWYTAVIVGVAVLTSVAAGYALTFLAVPFRRFWLIATLIAMIVPPVALVLPLFIEISSIGLYDTPLAVILTSSFFPFGVFLSFIYYSTSIPRELVEAARIDGAGEMRIFVQLALPLSIGLIGMLAFFAFTNNWINYFLPFVLLGSNDNFTLPVGLGVLFSATPAINPGVGASILPIGRPEIALAGLIVALPIMTVFLASTRMLVRGLLAGSVKS